MSEEKLRIWRLIAAGLAVAAFLALAALSIWTILTLQQQNAPVAGGSLRTELRRNAQLQLPDVGVCAPLTFMNADDKLRVLVKYLLLHDPRFLSQTFSLDDETTVTAYRQKQANRTTVGVEGLVQSFVNDTLNVLIRNASLAEESVWRTMAEEQTDVFDILQTGSGRLVNKTVLLATVAMLDAAARSDGFLETVGFAHLGADLADAQPGFVDDLSLSDEETGYVARLAEKLLANTSAVSALNANVSSTLCEILSPLWSDALSAYGLESPADLCAPDGPILANPHSISWRQFCFNLPISRTVFGLQAPSHTMQMSLPLAQTVFTSLPLSDVLFHNRSLDSSSSLEEEEDTATTTEPDVETTTDLVTENGGDNTTTEQTDEPTDDSTTTSSNIGDTLKNSLLSGNLNLNISTDDFSASLPFGLGSLPGLGDTGKRIQDNLTSFLNDSSRVLAKAQSQLDELFKTDLLSLAFKFPLLQKRTVSVFLPNDMRYCYSNVAETVYSRRFDYQLLPNQLNDPSARERFRIERLISHESADDNDGRCRSEPSNILCLLNCQASELRRRSGCLPLTARHLSSDGLADNRTRFCLKTDLHENPLDEQTCRLRCSVSPCREFRYEWLPEPPPPPTATSLMSGFNALTNGQPTVWSWTLICDLFEYIEYETLDTQSFFHRIPVIGGVLGFYATILGVFLLLLLLIDRLLVCVVERNSNQYQVHQIYLQNSEGFAQQYGHDFPLGPDRNYNGNRSKTPPQTNVSTVTLYG